MYKLGFREAEEPEIKLPTFVGSQRKQEFQTDSCFIDYTKAFVDHSKLWKILKEMGMPDHLTCFLRNLYASQETTFRIIHGTPVQNWERSTLRLHIVTLFI